MAFGRLHVITAGGPGADPVRQVRTILPAATADLVIQFRPADAWTDRQTFELAGEIVELCQPEGVPVLVNDRVDVAMAVGADGAHVGADDLPAVAARRILGAYALLGVTARTGRAGLRAVAAGADYLGVGPAYGSTSKSGLPPAIGPDGVAAVAGACTGTPVIAIGGVTEERVPQLLAAGAHGVAVIGAVAHASDPAGVVARLLDRLARAEEPYLG